MLAVDEGTNREYPSLAEGGSFPPRVELGGLRRSWWFPARAQEQKDSLVQVKSFPIQFCSGSEFLQAVAESKDDTFVTSLLVRSVLKYQWEAYGRWILCAQLALHVVTFAMLAALGANHPAGLADKSKCNFITLYIYICGIWPVLGCIDADLCK